jgi:hypothetical protein
MNSQQLVNAIKIAEELPHLESKYELIDDNIDEAKREMFEE